MYNDILKRLQSSDKAERIQAIKDLARTEDPAVLPHLSHMYKNDHDPDVRDVALRAGKYIRQKTQGQDQVDSIPAHDDAPLAEYEEGPEYELTEASASLGELTRKKKKNRPMEPVSAATEKRSKGLIDRAMNMSMSGDSAGAVAALRKAFTINPNLVDDDYSITLAADIMGLPKDDAIDELMYSAESTKAKRGGADDGVSWNTALADLATYGIVTALVSFITMVLTTRLFGDFFGSLGTALQNSEFNEGSFSSAEMDLIIQQFMNLSIPLALLQSLLYGVLGIVGLLITYALLHFVAFNILSGNGSFRKLIHTVTPFLSIMVIVQAVVGVIASFVMIQGMGDLIATPNMATMSDEEAALFLGNIFGTLTPLYLILIALSLGVLFWMCKLIGKAYDFSTLKGCFTIIISYILVFVVACGCTFVFGSVVSSLFAGAANMAY